MRLALLGAALLLMACPLPPGDDDTAVEDDATDDDDAAPLEPRWSAIQVRFEARCGCHVGQNRGDFTGLATYDGGYDALVGTASNDVPDMPRVTPFDPENSYLWHKLNNTQDSVGGDGSRMPQSQNGLPESDRDAVLTWIEAGAPKD